MEGHIEGMLDRDQRTAKLPSFLRQRDLLTSPDAFQERTPSVATPIPRRRLCCPTRTPRTKPSHLACRNGYLLNTFQSVKNVLIVVCITLVTVPIVSSKPVEKMSSLEELNKNESKWINPCGGQKVNGALPPVTSFNKTDLEKILFEADTVLRNVMEFKPVYAKEKFLKEEDKVKEDLHNQDLKEWLTGFYEVLGVNHAKVEDFLGDAFSLLQKMAVGLEQITLEEKRDNSRFEREVELIEHQVKRLLCEIQELMWYHGHLTPPDVQRDYMADEYRDRQGDTAYMKNRNFMIFRELVETLNYVKKAIAQFISSPSK